MNDIAAHLRITGLTFENTDVDARRSAAASLKLAWGKITDVSSILRQAQHVTIALTEEQPPGDLGEEVQAAMQKKASAFLYEDRPLEVGVVAGVAMRDLLGGTPDFGGWLSADVYAAAMWSSLSFRPELQEPKREALRLQVLEAARKRSIDGAEKARERLEVADFAEAKDDATLAAQFAGLTGATVGALRRNSALDREELDVLWWALADRSRILKKQLTNLDEPTRLIAAAIDASSLMRRLPCEVHRELVLRNLDADPDLTLPELLHALGENRVALSDTSRRLAPEAPVVFPVMNAMLTGETDGTAAAGKKRKLSEWAARALLEATLCHLRETGPRRK